MEEITLRPPRDDDWTAILELAERSISEMPSPPPQREWLENRKSFPRADGFQEHFVAIRSGRIVGYTAIERRTHWRKREYRLFVVVAPADRESLGKKLFDHLREGLLEHDAKRAWLLEYEADTNFSSFLRRLGFVSTENLNLPDGSTVVRFVLDAPFLPGVTPTWPNGAAVVAASYGRRFASRRMAENYRFRPPYSPEIYETLLELFGDRPRTLLDAGCGPGKITLGLIDHLERADAVDPSVEMLKIARASRGGNRSNIRWIYSRMEDAPLDPPYGLIVAAESIHWMDLERVLARFRDALAPGGFLALVSGDAPIDPPWESEASRFMMDFLGRVEDKHLSGWKTMRQQLESPLLMHRSFRRVGRKITSPFEFSQSIDDYLRCEHSRASWSEEHLGEEMSAEFDSAVRRILAPHSADGLLQFRVQTRIEWGHLIG